MNYPNPIGHDEKMRRKWWRFAVSNGWVTPAKKFDGKVSRYLARELKERSACNGEGTQFEYDCRTGSISGFFREISISFKTDSDHLKVEAFYNFRGERRISAEMARDRNKFRKEIKYTKRCYNILVRETCLLNQLRGDAGLPPITRCFQSGSSYEAMGYPPIEFVSKWWKQDFERVFFMQIETLQKLISQKIK